MPIRRVLVFDVNETMLDVSALTPHFARVFGDGAVLQEWFATLLLYSNVATVAGLYADFSVVAGAVLDMMATARGTRLTADDRAGILSGTRSLPAHPDVPPGLERLRTSSLRIFWPSPSRSSPTTRLDDGRTTGQPRRMRIKPVRASLGRIPAGHRATGYFT